MKNFEATGNIDYIHQNYGTVRDWVQLNEKLKDEMIERFPHLELPHQFPVIPFTEFVQNTQNYR